MGSRLATRRSPSEGRLLQLHLDAVGQHGDIADLVDLSSEAQLLDREGAKNLTLQQFLRDQAGDLLQLRGVTAADTLQLQALDFALLEAQGARRGVIAQRTAERDDAIDPVWAKQRTGDRNTDRDSRAVSPCVQPELRVAELYRDDPGVAL